VGTETEGASDTRSCSTAVTFSYTPHS